MLFSGKQNDVAGRKEFVLAEFFCSSGSLVCCKLNKSCCLLLSMSSALQCLSRWCYGGEVHWCRVQGHPQCAQKRHGEGSQWITYGVLLLLWHLGYLADLLVYAAVGLFVLKLLIR